MRTYYMLVPINVQLNESSCSLVPRIDTSMTYTMVYRHYISTVSEIDPHARAGIEVEALYATRPLRLLNTCIFMKSCSQF